MQTFDAPFGKIQILEVNDKFEVSMLLFDPGREITRHYHKKTKEFEIVLEGEIVCGDKIQKPGDLNIWEVNQAHSYKNESGSVVKILCVTLPPYDEKDVFEAE